MPLPEVTLDDRAFEDIVRDALRRIPTYTPEWTDLNDSDPGVTLLQLFAWLSEMILYRLNQVPDKNYLKFLDMIGIVPNPPAPAKAELTFSVTTKDPTRSVPVPKGTRVALSAPVNGARVIFETQADLNAVAASLAVVQSFDGGLFKLISDADHPAGGSFYPFGPSPQPGGALYLGFDMPFPGGVQQFRVHVDTSGVVQEGTGIAAAAAASAAAAAAASAAPPVVAVWEYWGGTGQWLMLDVSSEGTAAFVGTGDVLFNAPTDSAASKVGLKQRTSDNPLYWYRFRIVNVLGAGYETAPRLDDVVLNTVDALNAVTVTGELLGAADGSPNQSYPLANTPVIPGSLVLQVDEGQGYVTWTLVADLAASSSADTHYTLDPSTGLVQFGDGEHGKIPLPYPVSAPAGLSPATTDPTPVSNILASVYLWAGGAAGNAGPDTINALQTSVPYVSSVTNLRPSVGGSDLETVDQVRQRAPAAIRNGSRAVTSDDFEALALQTPGAFVARAKALPLYSPTAAPVRPAGAGLPAAAVPVPGVVTVAVIPAGVDVKPIPSSQTLQLVGNYLRGLCPVATELYVIAPNYREVEVDAEVIVLPSYTLVGVAAAVKTKLLTFFNPTTGGAPPVGQTTGTGWGFGDPISVAEVYRQILTTAGVDRIVAGKLTVYVDDVPVPDNFDVALAKDEIVYSENHVITARYS